MLWKRSVQTAICAFYALGALCVACLCILGLSGSSYVPFPGAMLPITLSELAWSWIALGTIPMLIASVLMFRVLRSRKGPLGRWRGLLIFSPAILCGCVVCFWIAVWGIGAARTALGAAPPQAGEDEIQLRIQMDVAEDIGLLLHSYELDGREIVGGMSHADRSLIGRGELLIDTLNRADFGTRADTARLTVSFTVVTEYYEPNYENLYPEESVAAMDAVSFDAAFGGTYVLVIRGDRAGGYGAEVTGSFFADGY